ncbi:MAG: hypothetical protein IPM78_01840 [Moraxellaceae bacterium]|nr:hypothetical protein [Moraxellaceae bacterium]
MPISLQKRRQAGSRKFVPVHILVAVIGPCKKAHDLIDIIEMDVEESLFGCHVTHLGPIGDPSSHHFTIPSAKFKRWSWAKASVKGQALFKIACLTR